MDYKTQLIDLILLKSYREGSFVLSSGQQSSFYIDLKATTLSPKGAFLIGKLAFERFEKENLLHELKGVGGLTLGADPIATAISIESLSRMKGEGIPAFIVRKEPKTHGTSNYIEGLENLDSGASVLIVEDVTTTGKSSLLAIERASHAGLKVVGVLTVVDREQGAVNFFKERAIPFFSLIQLSELKLRYRA